MDKNKKHRKWVTLSVKVEGEIAEKLDEKVKRGFLTFGSAFNRSDVVRDALRKYFEGL